MTSKQARVLDEAHDEIQRITGTNLGHWSISYDEETRPGRGHDITAWAADGEHMATQYLDPYGHGPLVVARMDVIHNDTDEEHFDAHGNCNHDEDQA